MDPACDHQLGIGNRSANRTIGYIEAKSDGRTNGPRTKYKMDVATKKSVGKTTM